MPNNRQKFNFYAVTHGKENGIYTSWTLAGDSVLGFAKAKFKGFCTYSEAAVAMSSAGYSDYSVFDGEHTYSKIDFEQSRGHQLCPLNTDSTVDTLTENNTSEISDTPDTNLETIPTVYIDGSCIRNGTSTAQAGYGIFGGDQHPWNCSNPLPLDSTATNKKAELMAAIKALQEAIDNNLKRLIVCSDSNYVIQGVTEWIYKWSENGWKTANGEDVKNKDIWKELAAFAQDSGMDITWKHVEAHSGIPENEEADKLALKAAKQIPVKTQIIEQRSGISSINSTSSTNAKPTTTKTQPKVIVIQKNNNSTTLNTTIQPEKVINTTPKRKSTKDRSETPVPGSLVMTFCLVSRAIKRTLFAWCYQHVNLDSQDTFDSNMSCHVIHFYFKPLTISIYLLLFITCILFCFFHFLLVCMPCVIISKHSFYNISFDLSHNNDDVL